MRLIAYDVQVGTTPTQVLAFRPRELHSVILKAKAALEIGDTSVSSGKGFTLSAGEALGFNHQDFDMEDNASNELQYIHAVAAVATEIRVFGWMR